jgi:hypothetical protein
MYARESQEAQLLKQPAMKTTLPLLLCLLLLSTAQAGAWGEGSFENDDALDWVARCTQSSGIALLSLTLNAIVEAEYIEAPDGSAAVAAVEVVAAALGKPSTKLPAELRAWIQRQSADKISQLAPLAKKALGRIQDPKVSELKQLWSEGKPNKWNAAIAELSARLGK